MSDAHLLQTDLPVIHLKPGDLHFSDRPEVVATVLGSCVAITMYNSRLKISAICHAALPGQANSSLQDSQPENKYKYLDIAFNTMYDWFIKHGVKDREIIIKAFGGGDVINFNAPPSASRTVGAQNIEAAIRLIGSKNARVNAIDFGGETGRKIFFYTHTGEVMVKRVRKTEYLRQAYRGE